MKKIILLLILIWFCVFPDLFMNLLKGQDSQGNVVDFPRFQAHLVDTLRSGYKVKVADLNNDGKPDIIGLSTNPAQLVWYKNPTWEKHIITTQTVRNIDVEPYDIDKDGRIDLALASEFEMRETLSGGLIQWFRNPGDSDQEWALHPIASEPTSHRLLWADVDGDRRKELIDAPIMGRSAKDPTWEIGVNLLWFRIPEEPAEIRWMPQVIDNQLTVLHGISVLDWDHDGRDDLLTASFEGVHLFQSVVTGNSVLWKKRQLGTGQEADPPKRGSSEIGVGFINFQEQRYLATIEPWHGDKVVVYVPDMRNGSLWKRQVIDSTFNEGHALVTADLDSNGTDEIVAGYRGKGTSMYIYCCRDSQGTSWERLPLDEGDMATSGIVTADLNMDGKLDIIAVGTSTNNIKWYENKGLVKVDLNR